MKYKVRDCDNAMALVKRVLNRQNFEAGSDYFQISIQGIELKSLGYLSDYKVGDYSTFKTYERTVGGIRVIFFVINPA